MRSNNNPVPLHYTWIGDPKAISSSSSSNSSSSNQINFGSDIKFIIATATICPNPIFFYCLDEHKTYYQNTFDKYIDGKVIVVPIKDYIKQTSESGEKVVRDFGKKLLEMKEELLHTYKDQGEIYDRVIFKSAFSLFLVANELGYILDTNVELNERYELPACDSFKSPYMGRLSLVREAWILYSPGSEKDNLEYKEVNDAILSYYLENWDKIREVMRQQLRLPKQQRDPLKIQMHHNDMSALLTDAITIGQDIADEKKIKNDEADKSKEGDSKTDKTWRISFEATDQAGVSAIACLNDMHIKKTYNNSHKAEYECKNMLVNQVIEYIKTPIFEGIDDLKGIDSFEDRNKTISLLIDYINLYRTYDNLRPDEKLTGYSANNYNLYYIFDGLKKLDQYALQLLDVSSNYKSKSKDTKKVEYALQIQQAINNAYTRLAKEKPPLKKINEKIIRELKEKVKEISEEAERHHQNKHNYLKKKSSRFFINVDEIFNLPDNENSKDEDKSHSLKPK